MLSCIGPTLIGREQYSCLSEGQRGCFAKSHTEMRKRRIDPTKELWAEGGAFPFLTPPGGERILPASNYESNDGGQPLVDHKFMKRTILLMLAVALAGCANHREARRKSVRLYPGLPQHE